MYHNSFTRRPFPRRRFHQGNGRSNQNGRNRIRQHIHSSKYINKGSTPVENIITVKNSFDDFQIDPRIKQNIYLHGYRIPTPIQDQAIGQILAGRDLIGIANTGTGKTAAFLIPLINKIIQNRGERVLIVIPTRELAVQINDELKFFSKSLHIYSVLVIGGVSLNRQVYELRGNPQIIISTPGRLKDLVNRRLINLNIFNNIVLDEVDRMVDIGFINDIKFIISKLPKARQSLFFSATIPPEVNSIIGSFLKNPVTVSVKVKETASGIDQDVIHIKDKKEKFEKLQSMLRQEEFKKVLIFGRTKWGVERLSKDLMQNGFSVASIHGNKSQNQRLRALSLFRQNQLQVLVATDVVARGMDIDDVSHVINFDEPSTYTDYIHRIGRTGRADKRGKALTFVG
ncbi:DEAD/DEAH box helicase [Candidatus Gottesmanbacteria bacterium]|nr:DEAD/DEAH box helicase [Candidatus Gottesmanbacteria bacterium]